MAMTESEILRRHVLYQTSFIGPQSERPVQSALPVHGREPKRASYSVGRTRKQVSIRLLPYRHVTEKQK